jgi:uncharacterized protein (TIGR02147 family)
MQNEITKTLVNEFNLAKARNPSYSLRAFASRLGIHVSALSEIMNGKRVITKKMGRRILEGLCYHPTSIEEILNDKERVADISLDYFKVISDWYYFAILSLAEVDNFQADAEWIADRLNISKTQAEYALQKLIELELLVYDKGAYKASGLQFKTPTDILNSSLKNHTIQTFELAQESILRDPVELRDFSTVTMAIDPDDLPVAKSMIKNFRKKLTKKLESGNKKEVYKLSVQLFPLSGNKIRRNQ